MEKPNSEEVVILKNQLREKYGSQRFDFWILAAQNFTIRIAENAMSEARKRDKGKCVLCELERDLIKEDEEAKKRRSGRVSRSHVISRDTIFWSEVKRIDLEYSIFSLEGTAALHVALKENPFMNNPDHIIMLCHEHDQLLNKTITQFSKDIS